MVEGNDDRAPAGRHGKVAEEIHTKKRTCTRPSSVMGGWARKQSSRVRGTWGLRYFVHFVVLSAYGFLSIAHFWLVPEGYLPQSIHLIPLDFWGESFTTETQFGLGSAEEIPLRFDDSFTEKIGRELGDSTFHDCSSPEKDIGWILSGTTKSRTSDLSCGLDGDSKLAQYLRNLSLADCKTVVYGVAFGQKYVRSLQTVYTRRYLNSPELLRQHGRCFFMFCLEGECTAGKVAHTQLIPIPRDILPYQSLRRNTKLLKYHGHFIFPNAKRIVWQDSKFFTRTLVRQQPGNYKQVFENGACVSVMTLPLHANTFGKHVYDENYTPQYIHHCETIIAALLGRPDVTDSAESLMRQCHFYTLHMLDDHSTVGLDLGMIDSAFIAWNYKTQECRQFNAELQCTLSDQLQCHSDRDQVSFPFAFAQMGLQVSSGAPLDQRMHDMQLTVRGSNTTMVHMTKSACHWYFTPLDECPDFDRPSIAILVAGSVQRYLIDSSVEHLFKPLAMYNYRVDYFARLVQKNGEAFRQSDYMNRIDPELRARNKVDEVVLRMRGSGASLRSLEFPKRLQAPNNTKLIAKRKACKQKHPRLDHDLEFPMYDVRPKARRRTIIGNRNMLTLFGSLEYIWDNRLVTYENSISRKYDYIMILRDDTLWLDDFDINKVLETNPWADAYVLSCDGRDPPMLSQEINDHGILIKRSKAKIVGKYFTSLLDTNLGACHKYARMVFGDQRGCNSEMILNFILLRSGLKVQRVPQSLIPFERSVSVKNKDGNQEYCFHKFCQSKESPLTIPNHMRFCKNMTF